MRLCGPTRRHLPKCCVLRPLSSACPGPDQPPVFGRGDRGGEAERESGKDSGGKGYPEREGRPRAPPASHRGVWAVVPRAVLPRGQHCCDVARF